MSFAIEHLGQNLWRGRFTAFPEQEVVHGFSGRLGGVSEKPWDSLNMGLHVEDAPEAVLENRRRFLRALDLKAELAVSPEQVHGTEVYQVRDEDKGRGALAYAEAIPRTDALITDVPGVPLLLCFADCVPLIFYDEEHHAIGAAHAGWKGTVGGVAGNTVSAMQRAFGTEPDKLLAGIGPAIGPCCYEVGEEVEAQFREIWPRHADKLFSMQEGRRKLDLWEANRQQLLSAGLPAANIECAETCTACQHKWFFSYRADGGRTGRLAAVIALKEY